MQLIYKLKEKIGLGSKYTHYIIEASGNSLNLEGSARLYIKIPQVLGDQIYPVEAAVLYGNQTDSELLISLDLLIEWNLVPKNFPNVTLDDHFKQLLTNKHFSKKYSSLYSKQSEEFSQSLDDQSDNQYEIPKPPKACSRLREKLLEKHSNVFKEKLSPSDRIEYSVHSRAAVDIQSREEKMYLALCTSSSGIRSHASQERKIVIVRR